MAIFAPKKYNGVGIGCMTSTIEKEQSWRLAITNSNNGYLDTDEIVTRFRVALFEKEPSRNISKRI